MPPVEEDHSFQEMQLKSGLQEAPAPGCKLVPPASKFDQAFRVFSYCASHAGALQESAISFRPPECILCMVNPGSATLLFLMLGEVVEFRSFPRQAAACIIYLALNEIYSLELACHQAHVSLLCAWEDCNGESFR